LETEHTDLTSIRRMKNVQCILREILIRSIVGLYLCIGNWGSSVNIVSNYGLDYRAIEDLSSAQARGLFL